jgi:hypothetical protein
MKAWIAVLLVLLVGALLVTGIVLAQGGSDARPDAATLSGGHYRLVSPGVGVDIVASGGGYTLLSPATSTQQGSGCCCTYLPCILRKH